MKLSGIAAASLFCLSAAASAVDMPHVINIMTTNGASMATGKRLPVQSFAQSDFVVQLTDFAWDNPEDNGGAHMVEWRWYRDGQLISKTAKKLDFNSTPYTIWTRRAASTLGAGHIRIEAVVDGSVVAESDVEIKP
jgi:hypothetical protein